MVGNLNGGLSYGDKILTGKRSVVLIVHVYRSMTDGHTDRLAISVLCVCIHD